MGFKKILIILSLLSFLDLAYGMDPSKTNCDTKIISTKTSGMLCGTTMKSPQNKTADAYLGIHYGNAERWKKAHADIKKKSLSINAQNFGFACPQDTIAVKAENQAEDCLYLNVWTPHLNKKKKLPVMIYIHGGSFTRGSGGFRGITQTPVQMYSGAHIVTRDPSHPVIFVTLNYRLGALGFLKDNLGIKDQRLALSWIKDNIEAFGGDPEQTMVFGDSAGSIALGIQLQIESKISDPDKKLFKSAIITGNLYGLILKNQQQQKMLQKKFNELVMQFCKRNPTAMCNLDNMHLQDLITIQNGSDIHNLNSLMGLAGLLQWGPYVDKILIKEQPALTEIDKPVLLGAAHDEGLLFANEGADQINPQTYPILLARFFGIKNISKVMAVDRYNPKTPPPSYITQTPSVYAFGNVVTDYIFTCASRYMLSRTTAPSYGFLYNHVLSYEFWPSIPSCKNTVCHTSMLPFTFGNPDDYYNNYRSFTDNETKLLSWVSDLWYNFTAYNEPKISVWEKFRDSNPGQRLIIDLPPKANESYAFTTDDDEYNQAHCDLWDSIGYGKLLLDQSARPT